MLIMLDRNHLSLQISRWSTLTLESSNCAKFEHVVHFDSKTSNNEVEYEAFLTEITIAKGLSFNEIEIYTYSQLVYNQALGRVS